MIGVEERKGHGLMEGGGLGLEGQGGRSVGVEDGEGHACHAHAGGAQLRIRAELGTRPTSMQNCDLKAAILFMGLKISVSATKKKGHATVAARVALQLQRVVVAREPQITKR